MSIRKTLCRVGLGLLVAAAVAVIACNGGDKGVTPPEKKPWGGTDATVTENTTTTKGMATAKGTATAVDPTVTIDGLTWMQKNLDIETPDSWCYEDPDFCRTCDVVPPDYCAIYGRLYTWEAAKSACESLGDGWRLPDTADWNNLANYAGGKEVAGKKLKSKSGWNDKSDGESGNGTDDYGFSALPSGSSYSDNDGNRFFKQVGDNTYFWSATEGDGVGYAYIRAIFRSDDLPEGMHNVRFGYAARCVVKIESPPTSIREVERRTYY